MNESKNTGSTIKKLKKLVIVSMIVCYVPLMSGCVQYVMLAMTVIQMVSGIVAQQREQDAREEAWEKGEPYVEDSATTNWKTASNLAGLGSTITSFGSSNGWWGGNETGGTNSGLSGSGSQVNTTGNTGNKDLSTNASSQQFNLGNNSGLQNETSSNTNQQIQEILNTDLQAEFDKNNNQLENIANNPYQNATLTPQSGSSNTGTVNTEVLNQAGSGAFNGTNSSSPAFDPSNYSLSSPTNSSNSGTNQFNVIE